MGFTKRIILGSADGHFSGYLDLPEAGFADVVDSPLDMGLCKNNASDLMKANLQIKFNERRHLQNF